MQSEAADEEKIDALRRAVDRCAFKLRTLYASSCLALFAAGTCIGYAVTAPSRPLLAVALLAVAVYAGMQAWRYALEGRRRTLRAQLYAAMRGRSRG